MKPLLGVDPKGDFSKLTFPLLCSPKVDGIRCLIHPVLGPVTRSLKPIPNRYVRNQLNAGGLYYLDGELILGKNPAKANFNQTQSAIMSEGGEPDFSFHVFDWFADTAVPYEKRLMHAHKLVCFYTGRDTEEIATYSEDVQHNTHIFMLKQEYASNMPYLTNLEESWLTEGFEGAMLRKPSGHYKFGRSTLREQLLVKLKRFSDGEAKVIGFQELQHNDNPIERNALGYAERSATASGLVGGDTLGALIVENELGQFKIGSGFTLGQRKEIWQRQSYYLGRQAAFKYQAHGMKDVPRLPIFKGWRED